MTHTLDKTAVKAILDALDDAERRVAHMVPLDHQEVRQIWLDMVRRDLRVARNRLLNVALTDVEVEENPRVEVPYNPAWTLGEIGADEQALMEANGWRMRPDGSYFKPGN